MDIYYKRDKSIDTIKYILMSLVIMGHCMEIFGLHKAENVEHIYQFIYLFHMPLFVFISGYFLNIKKENRQFYWGLILLFETFICYQIPSYIISIHRGGFAIKGLLNPSWAMWYLPALIVWRTVVFNIKIFIHKWIIVLFFVYFFAILGGFLRYDDFAVQRIISYFPFFIIGFYCNEYKLLARFKSFPVFVSSLICISCVLLLFLSNPHTSVLFYQSHSYFTQPICVFDGFIFRIFWLFITTILSASVFSLLLRFSNNRLSILGKFTLFFYVSHVLILYLLSIILRKYEIDITLALPILTFLSIIVSLNYISRSKVTPFLTNPISQLLKGLRTT